MNKTLEGKCCVVTGGSNGIGKALALKYAENGANVAVIGLNKERVEKTEQEIEAFGVKALGIVANIGSSKAIDAAIDQIEAKFQKIHILANCAGIATSELVLDIEEEQWDKVFDINVKAVFLTSRRVAKNMINNRVMNGKIISVSSIASKIGEVGNGAYCASKAALNSLTQVLGLELAQYGITVNTVCPGFTDTDMIQAVFRERGPIEGMHAKEYENFLTSTVPVKRMAKPEEIADFMFFLTSERANYITGVSLTISGGKVII